MDETVKPVNDSGQDRKSKSTEDALHECMIQLSNVLEITRSGRWEYDVASDTFIFDDNFYRIYRTTAEKEGGYSMSGSEYMRRFCHPDDVGLIMKDIGKLLESPDPGTARQLVHRIVYGNGETGYVSVRFLAVRDSDGSIVRTYGVNQDITEFRKIENEHLAHLKFFENMDRVNRALQKTTDLEKMMKDVLDFVLEAFECDRAFLLYPCDPDAPWWHCPMERTRPEYPGILTLGLNIPTDPEVAENFRILKASEGPVKFGPLAEHPLPKEISERFGICSFMSMAIYPKTGMPWQFGIQQCSFPRVWTSEEEKLLQEIGRRLSDSLTALLTYQSQRESEEFLNRIVENIPDMVFVKDAETLKFVRFNKAGEKLLGYSREEMIGKSDYDFFPEEADFFTTKDREVLERRTPVEIPEETILNRYKIERILHTKKIPVMDETGKPLYLLGISEDITEHKAAEKLILQSEEKFRTLFMSMSEGFYLSEVIYDDRGHPCDYRYLEVNPRFEQIIGLSRDQIIGRRYRELVPVDTTQWLDNYFSVAVTGIPVTYEFYSREYNMYFETYSYQPVKGQVSVHVKDVTERKKMEDQLRQVQKMEAIGRMAGGIAHDFNNILTAIMGCGAMLQIKMDEHDTLRRYVEEILSASQRAADLTRSLSVFSRLQPVNFKPLDINGIIKSIENLLKRLVTEDILIKTVLADEQPVIMGDPTQIDQIFFNLVSNARDAMPAGGSVIIETQLVELDDEFRRLHGYGKPGSYALISVSDTGSGMDESVKQKIFEPFFTTKEEGRGTGLGLANVYGIVKQHEGFVTVYSEPQMGTTFRLFFPAAEKTAKTEESSKPLIRGGDEVILIAEDNASVRRLMKDILSQYGYTIIEAFDGTDAVKQYSESGKIDLLVLDSVMPGKNGLEVYNEISRIKPDLKVLFTSGYTKDIILDKGIEEKKFELISKPLHPLDLVKKVREMLDG